MELKRKLSLWAYTGDLDGLLEIVEEYMDTQNHLTEQLTHP